MVTIQNSLKITLKSDLCAGSGFSYAGLIDSDISYDKYGVPFISGRRLKGCMKESAYMIKTDQAQIKRIFGVSGDNGSYGVIIGNAFPVGWKKKEKAIETLKEKTFGAAEYLGAQELLDQFTMVQAQTQIGESGVAQDGSLRFTRVVRQNNFAQKEKALVFEAPISYTCRKEEREVLEKAERKFETAVNSVSRSAYSGKRKKAQKAARAREQKKKKEQNRQTNKPDGQESGVPKEFMEILNRIVKERMKEQNYRNQEEEKCRKLDEKIRICQKARKEVAVAVEKEKQEKHHFFRKKKSDA